MVQYDTKMYLNYILNIIINIKLLIIPFLNLYRICMYSMWCDSGLNTDLNGLISCDLCEHNIRISLCQVSGSQNVTKTTHSCA